MLDPLVYDGLYLIEVDSVLRRGGYWILSGSPINWKQYYSGWERTQEDLKQQQDSIEDVAKRLCWKKVVEKDDLAIWQKPINHMNCLENKKIDEIPQMCSKDNNSDSAWYRNMENCITPLPEVSSSDEVAGGPLEKWPNRAFAVSPRIKSGSISGLAAEEFEEDNNIWKDKVAHYKHIIPSLTKGQFRNIIDMNAGLGGSRLPCQSTQSG